MALVTALLSILRTIERKCLAEERSLRTLRRRHDQQIRLKASQNEAQQNMLTHPGNHPLIILDSKSNQAHFSDRKFWLFLPARCTANGATVFVSTSRAWCIAVCAERRAGPRVSSRYNRSFAASKKNPFKCVLTSVVTARYLRRRQGKSARVKARSGRKSYANSHMCF